MRNISVIPGILSKTRDDYVERAARVASLSPFLHVDIADGKVVANRTLALSEVLAVSLESSLILHLMVDTPRNYLPQLKEMAQVSEVIFHPDWEDKPYIFVEEARALGLTVTAAIAPVKAGMKDASDVAYLAPILNGIMVMGIIPGFSGQVFRESALKSILLLHREFPDLVLSVDGGMNPQTVPLVVQAGASVIYATSYLHRAADPAVALEELEQSPYNR